MKVIIDARESGTTTGRYVDKLVEYLAKTPTNLEFVVLTKHHRLGYMKKIAPDFEVVESNFKEFTFEEQLGFKKQISSLKPDLVHFLLVQQPILYRGKVVTTIQDLTTVRFTNPDKNLAIYKAKQQVYKHVIKTAAKKSVKVIVPSEFVKEDVVDFTGQSPDKFVVTYEAGDKITDRAKSIPALKHKKFIMYVGRPMPHKNLERLIEAFILLKKSHKNLVLVLAGKKDANYKRIEDLVKERRIRKVFFTDFVSEGQLRWLYENCEAYVFPSLSEGFGLPPLEAMVHGAPVVSSSATCLPEINGDAAKYFDPLNVADMAEVIGEVIGNEKLRQEMIKKGYKQVAKYSWKRMAEQTLKVYEEALKS